MAGAWSEIVSRRTRSAAAGAVASKQANVSKATKRAAAARRGKRAITSPTQFVIITGLSGAGKTHAIHCFEDLGFFCVDNLPPALLPKFAELCAHSDGRVPRAAVVTDVRGGIFFNELQDALGELEKMGAKYRILFLEASRDALVKRFKETRRRHPLHHPRRSLLASIEHERRLLLDIHGRADKVIDTSTIPVSQLRGEIARLFSKPGEAVPMLVSLVSFGFKFGTPVDADLVFDVRFLPNPHYVASLRNKTGHSTRVKEWVLKSPGAAEFLKRLYSLLDLCLPLHAEEGKAYLTIAVGCTGGRHRSVVIANQLAAHLRGKGYRVRLGHRDARK